MLATAGLVAALIGGCALGTNDTVIRCEPSPPVTDGTTRAVEGLDAADACDAARRACSARGALP